MCSARRQGCAAGEQGVSVLEESVLGVVGIER